MWKKNSTKYEELKKLKRNKDELCYKIAYSSMKYLAKALYANYVITKGGHQEQGMAKLQ